MNHQETGATRWQTTTSVSTWTRSGTDGFLGLRPGAAVTGGLDPDGCLVRISPQPPLRTTGAYWKGGTTTTSGCGGLVLPVDYGWLMGDPFLTFT